LTAASTAQRRAGFRKRRREFEACAVDLLRSQAPEVDRVSIDIVTFHEWRKRHEWAKGRDGKRIAAGA
jgi:hypothetical protein